MHKNRHGNKEFIVSGRVIAPDRLSRNKVYSYKSLHVHGEMQHYTLHRQSPINLDES